MGGTGRLAGARVLVTGGCGLIGSRIGSLLRQHGASPVALDRLDAYSFDYATMFGAHDVYDEVLSGSVADPVLVSRAMRRADYVIHAAAYADVAACTANAEESMITNILGTQVVLEEVLNARPRRFIFVSSASIYGNGPRPGAAQRWDESTPAAPISVYANAKLWGEWQTRLQLQRTPVEHVSLRYFSVYGEPQVPKPGSHSWCVAWFGFHAASGLPMRLNHGGRQIRDFIHVDDVAAATVHALTASRAANQVVNVGTGIPTSVADIAGVVAAEFPGAERIDTPGPAEDPMGGYADITRMERVLEYRPGIQVGDGVRRYLTWLRTSQVLRTWMPTLLAGEQPLAAVTANGGR